MHCRRAVYRRVAASRRLSAIIGLDMQRLGWIGCCRGCAGRRARLLRWQHASTLDLRSRAEPGERISGNERLGWNQAATERRAQLATLRYAAYVDGTRVELTDVSCTGPAGGTAPCSSRMPAMSPGAHTIELASFVVDGGDGRREWPVAPPCASPSPAATAGATASGADCTPPASRLLTTADGAELRLDALIGPARGADRDCRRTGWPRVRRRARGRVSAIVRRTACSTRSRRSPSTRC